MAGVVGIDVGGAFTDLFFSHDGAGVDYVLKVPSAPDDPAHGPIDALIAAEVALSDLDLILHGTTIATNAVTERKGARCALVTTRGFRDVLELGRRNRQRMYGLTGAHEPLIPRALRWEVDEQLDQHGRVLHPLDEDEVRRLAAALRDYYGFERTSTAAVQGYLQPSSRAPRPAYRPSSASAASPPPRW